MNAINPYLQQYKQNQLETATPEEVLILLFDGAIQFLNKAKIALTNNNNEEYQYNLLRCEKIILEFMNSLDMELGGNLADRLYQLYEYYYNTLVNAGFSKDMKRLEEILHHLTNLRETWHKAIDIANAEKKAKLKDDDDNTSIKNSHNDMYVKSDEDEEEYDEDDFDEEEDI